MSKYSTPLNVSNSAGINPNSVSPFVRTVTINAPITALFHSSAPRIFGCIGLFLRLVIGDILHAQILEHLKQRLAIMSKCHRTVVRITLLDQYMTVESAHLGDGEDADAAEAAGLHRENLALCDVGAQLALAVALQPVEGHIRRRDISLQRAPGEVGLAARRLQQPVLNKLILHSTVRTHLAGRGIAAMESHEGIRQLIVELTGDFLVIDILGNRIVDVQQGHGIAGHAGADVLAKIGRASCRERV